METRQCCISLDEDVYRNWQAIGKLEGLEQGGDIAHFLVILYSSQKQSSGEECSIRCVGCHRPLTLYCSVCKGASHLAFPAAHTPSPSLSSPFLASQVVDASAPPSAHDENAFTLDSDKPAGYTKDVQSTASLPEQGEDIDCEDYSLELDMVKAESPASRSDQESGLTKAKVGFGLPEANMEESTQSRRSRRRKLDSVLGQGEKRRKSKGQRKKRPLNASANGKTRDDFPSVSDKTVSLKLKEGDSDKTCSDVTLAKPSKEKRKRKPCASHDLEEGCVLPAEERTLAQIHVYDDSYFERHMKEDEPLSLGRCEGRKVKEQRETFKNAPKTRARVKHKSRCVQSSSASSESSSTDEEMLDCESGNIQNNHRSIISCKQNRKGNLQSQTNGSKLVQKMVLKDFEHDGSIGRTEILETVDPDNSCKQPIRILVSAQKILPLRTTDGNYARFLYTYFECAHCDKAFTHKRAFNSHVQTHVGLKAHNCPACEKGVECACVNVKRESRPILQCEICGAHLKSLYALRFHIAAIHKNERPFKCELCEKSFVLKTKLRSHMKYKHAEGGRLFHCDQCSYRAFDARGLKVHQMCVHSKERPFKCTFCPSAFAIKFYLDVHLRKHTGEKPFRCSDCSQAFAQRPSLTRHRRKYHGLEPTTSSSKATDSSVPL